MSMVTNVVVFWEATEFDVEVVGLLNSCLEPDGLNRFVVPLDDRWYGGPKRLECGMAVGAFNGLDTEVFLAALRKVELPEGGFLQMAFKEESDDRFKLVNIS